MGPKYKKQIVCVQKGCITMSETKKIHRSTLKRLSNNPKSQSYPGTRQPNKTTTIKRLFTTTNTITTANKKNTSHVTMKSSSTIGTVQYLYKNAPKLKANISVRSSKNVQRPLRAASESYSPDCSYS